MNDIDIDYFGYPKTPKDIEALDLFKKNQHIFHLDEGEDIEERYRAANKMTKSLYEGTEYYVKVEAYCCCCTVSKLYKRITTI